MMYSVNEYLKYLRKEFEDCEWKSKINSIIIFGSLVNIPSLTLNKDIDLCVVTNDNTRIVLDNIKIFATQHFIEPDITIYHIDELKSNLPFRDAQNGIFALEYLALGEIIYGKNLFIDLITKMSKIEYKKSLIEKVFSYTLRIRRNYISDGLEETKTIFLNKYFARLLMDLMAYLDLEPLNKLTTQLSSEIFVKADNHNLIDLAKLKELNNENILILYTYDSLFQEFEKIVNEIPSYVDKITATNMGLPKLGH